MTAEPTQHPDMREIADLTTAVARYHAGCLRVIGAQNVALRDVRTTKKAALCCDIGVATATELLMAHGRAIITAPAKPAPDADEDALDAYHRQLVVWERLRDLAAKAAVDAHAKEVVYGFPMLEGYIAKKAGGKPEPVLAPLLMQSVTVSVTETGEIAVHANDEPPRFNVALWREAVSSDDLSQIVTLGIDAQADLATGYDPARVAKLLTAIATVFPAVEPGEPGDALAPWPEALPARQRPSDPRLGLHGGGVLFLANRSSPYLLADLQAIAERPDPLLAEDTPLSVLMSAPDTRPRPESVAPNLDGVVYPFPANAAQRQVADALDKNSVVVVQGPPGNGKSLTIANLVAHLVAQGKSVLVTSHKTQALTVVRDKLAETQQKFLYASLIGEGAQAKRELQSQIADVKAFAGAANRAKLERQMKDIDQRRGNSGRQYRHLRQQWLDQAEAEQAEAADQYEQTVGVPLMDHRDPATPDGSRDTVAAALRRLDEIARQHAPVWTELTQATATGVDVDVDATVRDLRAFLDQQRARLAGAKDPQVQALVRGWQATTDANPGQIETARKALDEIRLAYLPVLTAADRDGRAEGHALADAPPLRDDVVRGLEVLTEAFAEARRLAEHRDAVTCEPERRQQVVLHHGQLSSFTKRRNARKWLDEHAPGAAGLSAEQVADWTAFWDTWTRVVTHADGLAGGLRGDLPKRFAPDAAQAVIGRARRALDWTQAVLTAREAAASTRLNVLLATLTGATDLEALDAGLLTCDQALAALEADRTGNALKDQPSLAPLAPLPATLDAHLDAGELDQAAEVLAQLDERLQALPAVAERHGLLAGPLAHLPHATADLEAAAVAGTEPPAWLDRAPEALHAHPALLRFVEISASEDTREIARQLSALTDQVLDDARALLGGRIQQRILEGFRKPSFLASLEAFRKAISASPKRFERFEELKNSPAFDVDVLTDVFPCWIMRPEDACRVFPLRAGVFDVVIFDEASQCNPDQVVPLFARARHAIVVGDDKQLSNEDLRRSLSTDNNRALLKQAELDRLDPVGMFDQTQNSLLELVSRRQQAQVLLNEHFRCRPEIIAFSNKAFYGKTLSIIRDREDDRGLGPALMVRQVVRADGLPIVAAGKVNHVEADALVADLVRRLEDPAYDGMTFGVLSLFREQIEHIALAVEREVPQRVRDERRIICSTVDGFQGDERDVILYSWRYAAGDHPSVFAFTNGGAGEQRTNVALTRARHQSIHYVSLPVDEFPASARNVTDFLRHASDPDTLLAEAESTVHHEPTGRARDLVRDRLTAAGMEVTDDYVACGVSVDLLVRDPNAERRLAVFVDADRAEHRPVEVPERVDQHALLERAGWTVCRLPATLVLGDTDRALDLVAREMLHAAASRDAQAPEPVVAEVVVDHQQDGAILDEAVLVLEIAPEDRADYHWDVPSVPQRLASGEDIWMSQFEADLYDALTRHDHLKVVPQWPSRNKFIDIVVTDRDGRRLAVEADGSQHHQDRAGNLIPEDRERQALLEEAGWSFVRVAHRDFARDPNGELARVLNALADRPADPALAAKVWTDDAVLAALEETATLVETATVHDAIDLPDAPIAAVPAATVLDEPPATAAPAPDPAPFGPAPLDDVATHDAPPQTAAPAVPVHVPAAKATPRPGPAPESVGTAFDDLPLGDMVIRVTEVVLVHGTVPDADLPALFTDTHGVVVPSGRRRTLSRFAWTAKGKRYLDQDAEGNWVKGERLALHDDAWGEWTTSAIVERAGQLLDEHDEPFEDLLAEVYTGNRVPKLAMSIVGSAINAARKAK